MSNPFSLEGKAVLVTGANTGLGQGIAVAGFVPPTETEAIIKKLGRKFVSIDANLMTIEPVGRVVAETVKALGKIDILVNNAGIIRRADSLEFSEKDWDEVMNVNIKALFFLCQAAGREMVKQGAGKIINIASMLSFQGGIRVPSYTASKSGVAGITRLLANEWAAKNINVNAIAPGYMATDNTEQLRRDAARSKEILARIPAGRWGEASDVGGTAVFLASKAADYLHGAIIPVDGGWLAR